MPRNRQSSWRVNRQRPRISSPRPLDTNVDARRRLHGDDTSEDYIALDDLSMATTTTASGEQDEHTRRPSARQYSWTRVYSLDSLLRTVSPSQYNVKSTRIRDNNSDIGDDDDGSAASDERHELSALQRTLHVYDLVGYGIASTIGAGIFVVTGTVARTVTGPAIVVSYAVAAVVSALNAACYAEFASRIPVSGSAYTFSYATLGEASAFFVGWNLMLEYALSASIVARAWAGYVEHLLALLGAPLPHHLVDYPIVSYLSFSLLSATLVVFVTALMLCGTRVSARVNNALAALNVCVLLLVIGAGATRVNASNWSPFAPFTVNATLSGAAMVFFSYLGFDAVTTLAGESVEPERTVPRGIFWSLGIASALYIGVSLVLTGMVPYTSLSEAAPLSRAFEDRGMPWMAYVVTTSAVFTLASTVLAAIMGQVRVFYQMSIDGMLPGRESLGRARRTIPSVATLVTGALCASMAALLDVKVLAETISIGTLTAFSGVALGLLSLRLAPSEPRAMEAPLTRWQRWRIPVLSGVYTLLALAMGIVFRATHDMIYLSLVPGAFMLALLVLFWRMQQNTSTLDSAHRVFLCPCFPLVPCLALVANQYLVAQLPMAAIYRMLGWTLVGALFYLVYSIHRSTLNSMVRA